MLDRAGKTRLCFWGTLERVFRRVEWWLGGLLKCFIPDQCWDFKRRPEEWRHRSAESLTKSLNRLSGWVEREWGGEMCEEHLCVCLPFWVNWGRQNTHTSLVPSIAKLTRLATCLSDLFRILSDCWLNSFLDVSRNVGILTAQGRNFANLLF